ncbi:hypothetical protein ElyMa_000367500 [Elysia marginata]|uniref:Uncharacterized protein n=1 Tax=Elysia marginata TaxID=1093978 RepID=A0AAV4FF11_9GAST|nr:hypothetical protein ElyMa_000367500 [Elysia marginata]
MAVHFTLFRSWTRNCTTADQELLKKTLVQAQLQYLRHIIGKLVRLTGTLQELVAALREHISGSPSHAPIISRKKAEKRQRTATTSSSESSDEGEPEVDLTAFTHTVLKGTMWLSTCTTTNSCILGRLQMSTEGTWQLSLSFMEQCGLKDNSFRWPGVED